MKKGLEESAGKSVPNTALGSKKTSRFYRRSPSACAEGECLRAKLTNQPAQEPCGGKKGAVLLREQCFFCSLLYALPLE